ncbi:hypothetical protein SteCoe_9338 [Stentor coeruleus]|uniref:Uncharacterized protein n=1 Tax=Stentor coeruleus TaxID=5963 RepID=A0A1R2CI26_9CILI|nr:hypothetical protein SteCoe_9338 [Stentor coeruleus]
MEEETSVDSEMQVDISTETLLTLKKCVFSRSTKALFNFYRLVSHNLISKLGRIGIWLTYLGKIFIQLQIISLILSTENKNQSSDSVETFKSFINYSRFDYIANVKNLDTIFDSLVFIVVFVQAVTFLLVYSQLLVKKNYIIAIPAHIFGLLEFILENFLFIPIVTHGTINILQLFFQNSFYLNQYTYRIQESNTSGFYLLILPLTIVIISCQTVLKAADRSHSKVSLFHVLCLSILSSSSIFLNNTYFYVCCMGLGGFMANKVAKFLPYYQMRNNMLLGGLWTSIAGLGFIMIVTISLERGHLLIYMILLIFPCVYLVLNFYLGHCFEKILMSNDRDPYVFDVKLRHLINQHEYDQAFEFLKKGKEIFYDFMLLFIWEYRLYLKVHKDHSFALLKIISSNYNVFNKQNIVSTNTFRHFPAIEVKYLFFFYYKEAFANKTNKERIALKYLIDLSKFKAKDYETCLVLFKIIRNLLSVNEKSYDVLKNQLVEYYMHLKEKMSQYSVKFTKYNSDALFRDIHKSFEAFILQHKLTIGTRQASFEKTVAKKADNEFSFILHYSNMNVCTVIYFPPETAQMLKIKNPRKYLNKPFDTFVSKGMKKYFNKNFSTFAYESTSNDLFINRLYLFVNNKYYIEVSMTLKYSFLNFSPYFIANFVKRHDDKFISLLKDGTIIAFSKHFKKSMRTRSNIMEIYPDIFENFIRDPLSDQACYQIGFGFCTMQKEYFDEEIFILHFSAETMICVSRAESLMKRKTIESTNKRNSIFSKSYEDLLEPDTDHINMINRLTNILKFSNIIVFCVLILSSFSIILLVSRFIDNANISYVANDFGDLRHFLLNNVIVIRTLELALNGYPSYYKISYYQELIKNSTVKLEELLYKLDDYNLNYNAKESFTSNFVDVIEIIDEVPMVNTLNLFEGIVKVIANCYQIVEKSNKGESFQKEAYFLYHSVPIIMFDVLNKTIWNGVGYMNLNTQQALNYLYIIELSSIFPPIILLLISLPVIFLIEKINSHQWLLISKLPLGSLKSLETKLILRLSEFHLVTLEPSAVDNKVPIKSQLWFRYLIKISIFLIFSTAFSIISIIYCQSELTYMLDLRISHNFWGSLRKTMTNLTFFWGRELHNYYAVENYEFINDFISYPNLEWEFLDIEEKTDEYEHKIFMKIKDSQQSAYDYSSYINLLIGKSCNYFEISDCEKSILARGLDPGLFVYEYDIESFIYLALINKSRWDSVIMCEKQASDFEKAWDEAVVMFSKITEYHLGTIKRILMIMSSVYIFLIVCGFAFVVVPALRFLKKELLSKADMISIFSCMQKTKFPDT